MANAHLATPNQQDLAGRIESDRDEEIGSDQSEGGSEEEEEQDLTTRELNKIIAEFIAGTLKVEILEEDSERSKFLEQKTNDTRKNLLHLVAARQVDGHVPEGYHYTSNCSLQPLVWHLIAKHADLVTQEDHLNMTPLRTAIRNGMFTLVNDLCRDGNYAALSIAFNQQNNEGNNCLHEALCRTDKRNGTIIANKLIKCLENPKNRPSVTAVNNDHKTPLHIAVEWQRCTTSQISIVHALVKACPEALDINVCDSKKDKLSVYRYHEKTRQEAKDVANSKEKKSNRKLNDGTVLSNHKIKDASTDKPGTQNALKVPGQSDLPSKKSLSRPGSIKVAQEGQEPPPMMEIKRQPTRPNISVPMILPNETKLPSDKVSSAATAGRRQDNKSKKSSKPKEEVSVAAADEIRDLIKLRYMNDEDDHEKLVSYLYGPVQEKQIYWSLAEGPRSVDVSQLRSMDFLKFEDTLKFVLLPRGMVARHKHSSQQHASGARSKEGTGRDDYKQILRWLSEKGVRRVLDLHIDDLDEPSHSDDTIEESLKNVEVLNVWDWRRTDLSSEVIVRAAPKVTHAHLYWGGNNAVLRSWSEPDGLSQLKNLKEIVLHRKQGLETRLTENKNLEAFSKRLNSSWKVKNAPVITIEHASQFLQSSKAIKMPETSLEQVDEHKWLTCMDDFATYVHNISQQYEPCLGTDGKPRNIRIALIDDGFDISDQSLHEKVLDGRSFCVKDNFHAPYWATSRSHGTVMASLICRVCPAARLYILRLDEYSSKDRKKQQITAKSAQMAVRAAISKGVDIISMSWTIEETSTNRSDIQELENALKEASHHKILLFCSSNDEATSSTECHPSHDSTRFKIGAATAYGKVSRFTHSAEVDYLFPGDQVIKERYDSVFDLKASPISGSSVATALAAGLAALALWIVQFSAQHEHTKSSTPEVLPENEIHKLRDHKRMNQVFDAMGLKGKYIEVWLIFERACNKMKGKEIEHQKDIICEIARKIKSTRSLSPE